MDVNKHERLPNIIHIDTNQSTGTSLFVFLLEFQLNVHEQQGTMNSIQLISTRSRQTYISTLRLIDKNLISSEIIYLQVKCANNKYTCQGRIQDFKLGGAHFKKLGRAEGGAKIFGVFRVKKSRFYAKKSYLFPILGGRAPGAPPPESAPANVGVDYSKQI